MANAGEVVTRAEIFDKVWGTDWLGDMRTLDVHIRWLREKIEDDAGNPRLYPDGARCRLSLHARR